MADGPANRVTRQVHRLFNFGAIGTMSDAQLLNWFAVRRDDAAEAAFEELVVRHGPMVLRVCRSVLHDADDADDAFQATFLVLANRARTIQRRGSIAGWLFGVAQRVAGRVKRGAARRRSLNQRLAARIAPSASRAEAEPDWEVLHEEIERLPERLRTPIVLCYLEGQTSVTAASHLGLSETTIRGRLARGRERLRQRLIRRGLMTVAATFDLAGTATQAQMAVSANLVQSTTRIALGFTSGNAATVLARGVLKAMLLHQLKVAVVILLLASGGLCAVWLTVAAAVDDPGKKPVVAIQTNDKAAGRVPDRQRNAPALPSRLSGTVKVEGTGEPVAGARLRVLNGNDRGVGGENEKVVETGVEGQFTVDLKAGPVRLWLSDLPAGYVVANTREGFENLIVRPDQAAIQREFRVRKGTIWSFRFTRGPGQKPSSGFITCAANGNALPLMARAVADDHGQALLTLPTERIKQNLSLLESSPESETLRTGSLPMSLESDADFRPAELKEITRLEGNNGRYRLVDAAGRSAILEAPEPIQPVTENGHLLIRVMLPGTAPEDLATLTGQVVDSQAQPIAGAQVTLANQGMVAADGPNDKATTDDQGRFRLTGIPRKGIGGKPFPIGLLVTKEGYGGYGSPFFLLNESNPGFPQVVDTIRLERGVSISGIVVDHRGQPMPGVWVRSNQPFVGAGSSGTPQSIQADADGRFRINGLRIGLVQLVVIYGTVHISQTYLVDGSPVEARLPLPDPSQEAPLDLAARRAGPPPPIAVGQPAAEWQVGRWSDGRDHKLNDTRGKVVVVYFWGILFNASVGVLPALGKLAAEFQPRGVEFLTIHHAEPDEVHGQEQGRRVLAFKGAPLPLAIDRTRIPNHPRGLTAEQYGLRGSPVFIVIDRAGKIAFRSDTAAVDPARDAIFKQMGRNATDASAEEANAKIERALAEEIEKVLMRQD